MSAAEYRRIMSGFPFGHIQQQDPPVFNIVFPGPNKMPTPYLEIGNIDYQRRMFCQFETLEHYSYHGNCAIDPGDTNGNWDLKLFYFDSYCLCVASRETRRLDALVHAPLWEVYLKADGKRAYALRYFLLGCQHPNMQRTNPYMFEHHYSCPDCGYHAVHFSD